MNWNDVLTQAEMEQLKDLSDKLHTYPAIKLTDPEFNPIWDRAIARPGMLFSYTKSLSLEIMGQDAFDLDDDRVIAEYAAQVCGAIASAVYRAVRETSPDHPNYTQVFALLTNLVDAHIMASEVDENPLAKAILASILSGFVR